MDSHSQNFKIRLGLFVALGLALFIVAIFLIGRQKNMFNPVFRLTTTFYNVSGLQVGNNVRFSGINVGNVDRIRIINDSTVLVDMLIRKEVNQFIKNDSEVAVGSEGLIGDRLLVISQGGADSPMAEDGQLLLSTEPVETDEIIESLLITAGNAEIITDQMAEIMININSGKGTLGKLIRDTTMADDFRQTMENLESSTKGLDENMEAAKSNFLLRGYFKKKAKEAERKKKELEARKAAQEKEAEEKNK
jgi:phospholipid/cholesterol/gamma-HCH transport system substrate-binding protein